MCRGARRTRRDAGLGCALLAGDDAAGGLRPRGGGSRHRNGGRRQHRRLHADDDDRDRTGTLERRPAARHGTRDGADHVDHRGERASLGRPAPWRNTGGLIMRAPVSDLPVAFENASLRVGDVHLLSNIDLALGAGAPTVLLGPNGSGKSTLLRLAMGLVAPTSGRVTWGGRDTPGERLAMVFQRPVMLPRAPAAATAPA